MASGSQKRIEFPQHDTLRRPDQGDKSYLQKRYLDLVFKCVISAISSKLCWLTPIFTELYVDGSYTVNCFVRLTTYIFRSTKHTIFIAIKIMCR